MDVIFLEEQTPRYTKRQTNLAKVWGDLLPSKNDRFGGTDIYLLYLAILRAILVSMGIQDQYSAWGY
jgi:hypothetical protein